MFDRTMNEHTETGLLNYGTDVRISVYKIGGGTIGRSYTGTWAVLVESMDEAHTYLDTEELWTGIDRTHTEIAALALDFAHGED